MLGIPGLENAPPELALLLGFFIGIALRRSRINALLNRVLPGEDSGDESDDSSNE